jgi:hypothetical protein
MSDENNKETLEAGVDAVDAAEIGVEGEVPVAGTILHGALALTDLGEAGIDHLFGDEASEDEHLKEAGLEGIKAIPGAALGTKFIGDQKLRARLYGEKYEAPPETRADIDAKDGAAREEQRGWEAAHPDECVGSAGVKHRDPADVQALYEIQQWRYQAELADQDASGRYDADGHLKHLDYPMTPTANDEADTLSGQIEAGAYNALVKPMLSTYGIEAPEAGEPQ